MRQFQIQEFLINCLDNNKKKSNQKSKKTSNKKSSSKKKPLCNKYMNMKFIREIQSKRYREWIKEYKFM